MKKNPNFQYLTRDEATAAGFLANRETLKTLRDSTLGLYVDGTAQDRRSVNDALDSLGFAMANIIPESRRSDEWKNFHDSVSKYTHQYVNDEGLPARPGEPGAHPRYGAPRTPYRLGDNKADGKPFTEAERINEVFDSIEKYIKGKKSLRSSRAERERFDLAMDALAIVSRTSPAAKARADSIVQRINYVRTHRPLFHRAQPTINLDDYGRERGRNAIRERLIREGINPERANLLVPPAQGVNPNQPQAAPPSRRCPHRRCPRRRCPSRRCPCRRSPRRSPLSRSGARSSRRGISRRCTPKSRRKWTATR